VCLTVGEKLSLAAVVLTVKVFYLYDDGDVDVVSVHLCGFIHPWFCCGSG
jgi:hypothetical protein